jgi:hypothetical protein
VLADCRKRADEWVKTQGSKPRSRVAAVVIVLVWIGFAVALWIWLVQPRL